jgi:alpha-tubulin suppressor-like RCC1 family protein
MVLDKEGNVYSFGSNAFKNLGFNSSIVKTPTMIKNLTKITKISMSKSTLLLDENMNVYCIGENSVFFI